PGDYDLFLRDGRERTRIALKVTAGAPVAGWLLSDVRNLQVRNPAPLQIESLQTADDAISVRLRNATTFTRVHVAASAFIPDTPWRVSSSLSAFQRFNPA